MFSRLRRAIEGPPESRRLGRAVLSGTASVTRLGAALASQVLILPMVSAHLDPERFGLWCSLTSLFLWVTLLDFGLPRAVINIISEADGLKSDSLARKAISSAFWLQAAGLAVPALLGEIVIRCVDLHPLLRISPGIPAGELALCLRATLYLAIVNTQCALGRAAYTGFQLGYRSTCWEVLGAVLTVPAVAVAVRAGCALPGVTAASLAPLVAGLFGSAATLFFRDFAHLRPSLRQFSMPVARRLLRLGSAYLLAQLTALVMQQGQPWILLACAGAAAVGPFAVAHKLVTLPAALMLAVVAPFQPAFGEASIKGDWEWIRRTYRNTVLGSVLYSVAVFAVLILVGQSVTRLLLRQAVPVSQPTFVLLCAYMVVNLIGSSPASLLYGLGRPRGPALYGCAHALVLLPLGFWMTGRYGPSGLAVAMLLAMSVATALPQLIEAGNTLQSRGKSRPRTATDTPDMSSGISLSAEQCGR